MDTIVYNNYVETLSTLISEAKDHYDIWWLYKEEKNREKYHKVLETYHLFFHYHYVHIFLLSLLIYTCFMRIEMIQLISIVF